jgi:hypothetical protein
VQVHQRLLAVTRPLHVAAALSQEGAASSQPPPAGCISCWVKPLQHATFQLSTMVGLEEAAGLRLGLIMCRCCC